MPRRPRPAPTNLSFTQRALANARRNPIKWWSSMFILVGAIPGAVAGWAYIQPAVPVLHFEVGSIMAPVLKVQNTQALSIDRFLLYQQQQALTAAKTDPAYGSSSIVQERAKELESIAKDTRMRICKTTNRAADCQQ